MEVMTVYEVASFLHCSVSNIRNMVKDNQIPFFRLGYRLYFNKNSIIEWLNTKEKNTIENNVIKIEDLKNNNDKSNN